MAGGIHVPALLTQTEPGVLLKEVGVGDWSEDQFNEQLLSFMERAFQSVWEGHIDRGVDLRTAAYMVGINRVAEATRLRGLA